MQTQIVATSQRARRGDDEAGDSPAPQDRRTCLSVEAEGGQSSLLSAIDGELCAVMSCRPESLYGLSVSSHVKPFAHLWEDGGLMLPRLRFESSRADTFAAACLALCVAVGAHCAGARRRASQRRRRQHRRASGRRYGRAAVSRRRRPRLR